MSDHIVHSPYPDIDIPEDVTLPEYMFEKLRQFGTGTALVSFIAQLKWFMNQKLFSDFFCDR